MSDPKNTPAGSEPPPSNTVTYTNPRRTSPEASITLRHHRMAREASKRHPPTNIPAGLDSTNLPRRNSSGESLETGRSDGRKWFDRTNQNFKANWDTSGMDVDPPFFQKESSSSNEDGAYHPVPSQSPAYRFVQSRGPAPRPEFTQSSSADDYRSVIDDLTIENRRLKEELKRYRQMGPDSLRRDKLFEVKVHGLPRRKKRELEAALRDFTTSLEGTSTGESPGRRKGHGKSKNISFSAGGMSKHASSAAGSNPQPVDSAYGTMSGTGAGSTAPSLTNPSKAAKQRSNAKIESYLRDIPDGLWPRTPVLTEKDRKKLVVRRLEHLFTGKMGGRKDPSQGPIVPASIAEDVEMETRTSMPDEKSAAFVAEASREAKIRPREYQLKGYHSLNTGSASNEHSYGDQADPRYITGSGSGHGGVSGNGDNGGSNTSPQALAGSEQRPTRPRDLDPNRSQIPSENMDYIRHLGLIAPESQKKFSAIDVSPDAEGWVYLNLLCNLAQLHIFNVTPDFIRSAVTEKSTKFQLSPDGRKIRWRGGEDGTKFSSDSSGKDSLKSQSSDETDGSNNQDQRKKQKTHQPLTVNDGIAPSPSNFKPQAQTRQGSNSSGSFHYKPLFVHHNTSSSEELPSEGNETSPSYVAEESNQGPHSRWGQSGVSGPSQRKRRRDGAIIYYSGAPFCTDLSGDIGEVSSDNTIYDLTSSGDQGPLSLNIQRPKLYRSASGSTIPYRPLSGPSAYGASMDVDDPCEPPELTSGETDNDDIDANFEWSDSQRQTPLIHLEASGLAGIYPEDHFAVVVATKRPKSLRAYDGSDADSVVSSQPKTPQPDLIASKLAAMTTESPRPCSAHNNNASASSPARINIQYLSSQTRRLAPAPLPPPAFYYDSSNSDQDDDSDDDDDASSDGFISRRATLEDDDEDDDDDNDNDDDDDDDVFPAPQGDLSGNDEEDEHSDDANIGAIITSAVPPPGGPIIGRIRRSSSSDSGPIISMSALSNGSGSGSGSRSSVATAGGAPSHYDISMDEDV